MNFENFLNKQASEEARQAKEQAQQAQDQAKIAQDLAQRQSELDKAKIDDLELAIRVASLPSISSPVPNTNLLPAITAAAPIDEHRLNQILTNDANAREDRMLQNIVALENHLSNISQLSLDPMSATSYHL